MAVKEGDFHHKLDATEKAWGGRGWQAIRHNLNIDDNLPRSQRAVPQDVTRACIFLAGQTLMEALRNRARCTISAPDAVVTGFAVGTADRAKGCRCGRKNCQTGFGRGNNRMAWGRTGGRNNSKRLLFEGALQAAGSMPSVNQKSAFDGPFRDGGECLAGFSISGWRSRQGSRRQVPRSADDAVRSPGGVGQKRTGKGLLPKYGAGSRGATCGRNLRVEDLIRQKPLQEEIRPKAASHK